MSCLWHATRLRPGTLRWNQFVLGGEVCDRLAAGARVPDAHASSKVVFPFQLVRVPKDGGDPAGSPEEWVLIAPANNASGLRVNGREVLLGIHVMRDRDEVRWEGGLPLYFSKQQWAVIEPFPGGGGGRSVRCVRCAGDLKPGQLCVRCPNPSCGAWHHQMEKEESPCWTYAEGCASCRHPTGLGQQQQWSPELIYQS